jgi:hypothetical protein
MSADILGYGDRWKAQDGCLASGRGGTRDVGVDAEIRAVIDASNHPQVARRDFVTPDRLTSERRAATQSDACAIGGGPPEPEAPGLEFLEGYWLGGRHGVTDATLGSAGRDDQAFGSVTEYGMKGCNALRFHSIIIREHQQHRSHSRLRPALGGDAGKG